ncbi:wax ester/triacylglycerol synthase family O-acyltransferase [Mycobacterium shinjukuense]|uniref:Diacylglycerol O-acyltransferase n=1 Tax=Mycobacterium shinjukuense TaxID=398694 RepID=A0A7I7MR59_9MYCO|nr:wax ester/triacylglycerol synthase family O-acyltransferase [Mycobacterium shinjukuense]MCV6987379.1 wax ester/triacylglycerol synthase family O-acyltransferase [Mycobacterium shinjukuense]ORB62143.1 diacylglycerol O-acyltransferase [Mycobacterium shinjukuense]BBX74711.1 diacylglycerol O-acyltransferase [Mycobacterium shinjukuense]
MAQLTALDAGFLTSRDPERHPSLAIGAVAVVNGAAPSYDQLKTVLAERLKSIPRCTQVLAAEWIDYPGFDLTQHVRRVALPRPGDEAELFRAIALALERPLDPDRPLWECWIIEGLDGNRWAILIKIHHCMAGAMSAAHLLARLCDDANSSAFANNVDIKQIPPHSDARGWADTLWRTSVSIAGAVCTAAARAASWPAVTSPARPVTTRRRYQTVRVPRAAVDAVCHKFGVTANDVALAAITEGFRTVLLHRGQQPRADSLRTLEKSDGSSAMLPYLPVDTDDPVQRLRTVHNRLNQTQHNGSRTGSLSDYTPFMLCAKMIHALARLPQQGIITLATSAPGPRHQLRLMGQKVDQVLPIPPTALQLSTGVAVLSYGDELVFGITADYDAASEMQQLVNGIELGVARLVALSHDSVLLFTKDRRKRSSRALPSAARRGRPSVPTARARH